MEEKRGQHCSEYLKDKKAQSLSTSAIVLIVLGVVILVILIVGFSMGWDKIAPWIQKDTSETVRTQCQTACSSMNEYDYFTKVRTLRVIEDKTTTEVKASCYVLAYENSFTRFAIPKCDSFQTPACERIGDLSDDNVANETDANGGCLPAPYNSTLNNMTISKVVKSDPSNVCCIDLD